MEEKNTKISLIMSSLIRETSFRYLKISHEDEDGYVKLKTDLDSKMLSTTLNEFFDSGYNVTKISKEEFNEGNSEKEMSFIVKK